MLGPECRLAIQNELLTAQLRTRVNELAESRARVVLAADSERHRLERDLHDGAQQRVLALAMELRRARRHAQQASRVGVAERCRELGEVAAGLLERLREISEGLYPVLLDVSGLGPALGALNARRTVPRDVQVDGTTRPGRDVERAAYAVLADSMPERPGRTAVELGDDAVVLRFIGSDGPSETSADRIYAAGGTVRVVSGGWEAELPCGS